MANENKNTNELVSEDDDPTSELEALTWRHAAPSAHAENSAESEANTFNFEQQHADDDEADQAIEKLRSDLALRSETIDRLQFDIEQLHAKWVGLETEIKAREELTSRIVAELDDERRAVTRKDELLLQREQTVAAQKAEIQSLEQMRLDLEATNRELSRQLRERDRSVAELGKESESIRAELELLLSSERDESKRIYAEQSGQIASRDSLIDELRSQVSRTESYADGIRQQLQDQIDVCQTLASARDRLASSLDEAAARIETLTGELDGERAVSARHDQEIRQLTKAHEEEIRTIRFELGEAQATISQHEVANEKLTSDLFDTRGFKAELERMLAESEELRRSSVDDLETELKRLKAEAKRHEQKLATKNEAINCLLAELTQKKQQIESIGRLENVIHEIDDRMSERFEERGAGERGRTTRQLIGTIDEQELRFPLFKKRLTIGRTQQNDIQLKAPYVSRRHAVIVTEGERTRVVDWGSKNGVYVNSARVTEHFLSNGDIVRIGMADFRYEERPKRDA